MELGRVLYLPYQLVRRPLAVVDRHAVSRLAPDNRIRGAYQGALGVVDTVMALVLDERGPIDVESPDRDRPADRDRSVEREPGADHPSTAADEQRRQAFARKQDQVTRANHSPAAMKRDLARMQAVVEAREDTEDESEDD